MPDAYFIYDSRSVTAIAKCKAVIDKELLKKEEAEFENLYLSFYNKAELLKKYMEQYISQTYSVSDFTLTPRDIDNFLLYVVFTDKGKKEV